MSGGIVADNNYLGKNTEIFLNNLIELVN